MKVIFWYRDDVLEVINTYAGLDLYVIVFYNM